MRQSGFLVVFLAGLALGVHTMLHGVSRWRRRRSSRPSAAFNPPTVAALAIGFGASGYLLSTRTSMGLAVTLIVASLIGVATFSGMTLLMAKWALRSAGAALQDEEEEIHGQVAMVSRAITGATDGEITYFAWGKTHVLPARSLEGVEMPPGTEVVIDRLEDGIARVELWSVVEQRL